MGIDRPISNFHVDIITSTALVARRVEDASQEYRMRLQQKVATMRAAVAEGETADPHILAVVDGLERLAEDADQGWPEIRLPR